MGQLHAASKKWGPMGKTGTEEKKTFIFWCKPSNEKMTLPREAKNILKISDNPNEKVGIPLPTTTSYPLPKFGLERASATHFFIIGFNNTFRLFIGQKPWERPVIYWYVPYEYRPISHSWWYPNRVSWGLVDHCARLLLSQKVEWQR